VSKGGFVPLSDHEQRLLEQIEQALYAEDPKFASIYRANDLRSHRRRRVIRAAIVMVVGLALLLAGVITKLIVIGVAGFVLMLAAATFGVASWQRMSGAKPETNKRSGSRSRPRRPRSPVKRLEERWQRRQDDR
jgi:hypothetical protein